jgi:hypothetical protein
MKNTLALRFKNWFLLNYKILILSLIITCFSFPDYTLYYLPGIDGPLPWVFNYFADGHYLLGKELLFPHGPLAFLLYPLPMGNNLTVTLVITFLCSFLFNLTVFKIYHLKKQGNYLLPALILLILQSSLDLQLIIIGLTLNYLILFDHTSKKINLLIALFFCVFNLYIKTYGGIICVLIVVSDAIHSVITKKNIKHGLQTVIFFFIFFYFFSIALYQTFSGSLHFLFGQYQLSSDNSEAVSFYQENNWWLISISLMSILAIPFFSKEKTTRYVFILMIFPLFAAWKHGMARADNTHITGFLCFIILFSFMIWLVSDEKKITLLILCLVSIGAFSLDIASTADANGYAKEKNIALFKPFNLYNLICNYDSISNLKNRFSKNSNASEILPDSILKIIGKKTADVFPWNYSIIAVNHLNWIPRPTIHSYASYTHWLDEQNAKHIQSGNSAQFLIWEIININMAGIDYRYLLNDAPNAIITFFCHYELKYKDNNYLIYEKRPVPARSNTKTIAGPVETKYNTWIDVPSASRQKITRARIKIKKSFLGFFKSLLYKGESFSIFYETADKKIHSHKIVPKNAEDGLWLNPFILEPGSNYTEPVVKKIKLNCWDERMVKDTYTFEFEEIGFSGNKKDLSVEEIYFNKK